MVRKYTWPVLLLSAGLLTACFETPQPEQEVTPDPVTPAYYVGGDISVFLLFFNQNSSKAKRRLSSDEDIPAFRDQVIASAIPDLCQSLFRKPNMGYLDENDLSELLKQLRFRFSSNINQLARISGLSYEKVASLLDKA